MHSLKLTLLFCFFTTILFSQQEYPGYIVKLEGDTLRGRITLMPTVIKFRQDNVKTKYQRRELADYGYYGNGKFFPKPDLALPAKESNRMGTIILVSGDTLQNFHIHSIRPNVIIGYFEYPKYIVYDAKIGELEELITLEDGQKISLDLIAIPEYPKKGEVFYMYAKRAVEIGLSAYNIDHSYPCNIEYVNETFESKLIKHVAPLTAEVFRKKLGVAYYSYRNEKPYNWIIKKGGVTFNINNSREWKKSFDVIFGSESGFLAHLKKQNIDYLNISKVLKVYGDFIKS